MIQPGAVSHIKLSGGMTDGLVVMCQCGTRAPPARPDLTLVS